MPIHQCLYACDMSTYVCTGCASLFICNPHGYVHVTQFLITLYEATNSNIRGIKDDDISFRLKLTLVIYSLGS